MSVVINGTSGITTPGLDASGTNKFAATVGVGGATPAASGAGITFPATQSASTDANTLDDYEEGTWTGTLKGGVTDPTTPVTATGYYTKIGRLVTVSITFDNVNTTGANSAVSITGLPFTSSSNNITAGSVGSFQFDFAAGTTSLWSSVAASTTIIDFITSGDSVNWASLLHLAGTGRYLRTSITYFV